MTSACLFDKVAELKAKFQDFRVDDRKFKALRHYSECGKIEQPGYLELIRFCMQSGFLQPKEKEFLDHMIDRYALNYLDWAYKTKWLKKEMTRVKLQTVKQDQEENLFTIAERNKKLAAGIPFEVMAQAQQARRIAKSA